ncbi:MAG: hypothetical protein H7Y86_08095 [Rhizobacter sp.]|nr:hypothetical protein [Ferruginibacter sp.]
MDPLSPGTEASKNIASKIILFFDLADIAFHKYLPNKFLLHALCIRKSNEAIYRQLTEHASLWPEVIQKDVALLLNHYDIWFTQFDDFLKTKTFALNEAFIFYHLDDQSAFPKTSAKNIYDYCKKQL